MTWRERWAEDQKKKRLQRVLHMSSGMPHLDYVTDYVPGVRTYPIVGVLPEKFTYPVFSVDPIGDMLREMSNSGTAPLR